MIHFYLKIIKHFLFNRHLLINLAIIKISHSTNHHGFELLGTLLARIQLPLLIKIQIYSIKVSLDVPLTDYLMRIPATKAQLYYQLTMIRINRII